MVNVKVHIWISCLFLHIKSICFFFWMWWWWCPSCNNLPRYELHPPSLVFCICNSWSRLLVNILKNKCSITTNLGNLCLYLDIQRIIIFLLDQDPHKHKQFFLSQSEQWNFFSVSHDLQLEQSQHQSDVSSWRIKKRVGGSTLSCRSRKRGFRAAGIIDSFMQQNILIFMYFVIKFIYCTHSLALADNLS